MELKKTLDKVSNKKYPMTRRFTGRRGITPMKSKHKKIAKTRNHKVEGKRNVQLLQHTKSRNDEEWKDTGSQEYCEDSKRQGDKDSGCQGKWEDTKECAQTNQGGNTENTEKSIHPGPIQTVSNVSESATADDKEADKTEIEAEELQ
jgi:hypothetical protein